MFFLIIFKFYFKSLLCKLKHLPVRKILKFTRTLISGNQCLDDSEINYKRTEFPLPNINNWDDAMSCQ